MSSRNRLPLPQLLALSIASLGPMTGCLPGLSVVPLQSASGKPANVAVYMKVETNDGKPVPDLNASHFTIFEDGTRLSRADTKQTILSPSVGAARDTLLLIDVSGTTVGAKEVGDVIKAASAFTERVQRSQSVAVYTFDGSPDLNAVVPFASQDAASASEHASAFKPKDPKTSLDAAVIDALRILRGALTADPRTLKFGTLVVFTDGTNRGTLSSAADLRTAMASPDDAKIDVFAVGIGGDVDATHLAEIGRSGTITEADPANMTKAFDSVAAKVVTATGRYYLLSYCSPAREGSHEVRIEAHSHDGLIGDLTYRFSADGFGPGCDPTVPTGFEAPRAEPPPKKEPPRKPAKKPAAPPQAPAAPAVDPFAP